MPLASGVQGSGQQGRNVGWEAGAWKTDEEGKVRHRLEGAEAGPMAGLACLDRRLGGRLKPTCPPLPGNAQDGIFSSVLL